MSLSFSSIVRPLSILALTAGMAAVGCTPSPMDIDDVQEGCGSTHELVGATAEFNGRFHDVAGTLEVVDDCTLRINNFEFDGQGLDVRLYARMPGGTFEQGIPLTNDLRKDGGYNGTTLDVPLPEGIMLDEIEAVSVWCVSVNEDFGNAVLAD